MAEHVTQFDVTRGRRDRRLELVLARFGPGGQARSHSRRDAVALFLWLKAGKARLPVRRVTRHVCRHDEGIGACTVDQEG